MTSPDRALGRMDPAALRLVIDHARRSGAFEVRERSCVPGSDCPESYYLSPGNFPAEGRREVPDAGDRPWQLPRRRGEVRGRPRPHARLLSVQPLDLPQDTPLAGGRETRGFSPSVSARATTAISRECRLSP